MGAPASHAPRPARVGARPRRPEPCRCRRRRQAQELRPASRPRNARGCHRIDGVDNGIPSIVGWDAERFVTTMRFYQAGRAHQPRHGVRGKVSRRRATRRAGRLLWLAAEAAAQSEEVECHPGARRRDPAIPRRPTKLYPETVPQGACCTLGPGHKARDDMCSACDLGGVPINPPSSGPRRPARLGEHVGGDGVVPADALRIVLLAHVGSLALLRDERRRRHRACRPWARSWRRS